MILENPLVSVLDSIKAEQGLTDVPNEELPPEIVAELVERGVQEFNEEYIRST